MPAHNAYNRQFMNLLDQSCVIESGFDDPSGVSLAFLARYVKYDRPRNDRAIGRTRHSETPKKSDTVKKDLSDNLIPAILIGLVELPSRIEFRNLNKQAGCRQVCCT